MPDDYELFITVAEELPYVEYVIKAGKILALIYTFGQDSEEEKAIKALVQQVQQMKEELSDINDRVSLHAQRMQQAENLARLRQIGGHRDRIDGLLLRLDRTPDVDELADIANTAALTAENMLDDTDLWLWSDTKLRRSPMGDEVLDLLRPEFKVLPLPVFGVAVATFALASAMHIAQEPGSRSSYASRFTELHAAVTVRPDWVDGESEPSTLPERVRAEISVEVYAKTKYVTGGQCVYGLTCLNRIDRTRKDVGQVSIGAPADAPPSTMCTAPADLGVIEETLAEDEYEPIKLLGVLENMLESLRTRGTLAEPFVGQFPSETYHWLALYAVEPGGNLLRFTCDGVSTALPGPISLQSSGTVIGTGWQNFRAIVAGFWNVLYAVQKDGAILWYRHDGAVNDTFTWSGPRVVGRSLFTDSQFIAGSYGTMYRSGLLPAGRPPLAHYKTYVGFHRHRGVERGEGTFAPAVTLASHWQRYETVFGAANGVIYGITDDGRLFWHKHTDAAHGGTEIEGPHQVGNGWNGFSRVFSLGWGFIFGVYPNGETLAYRHHAWLNGPSGDRAGDWSGPVPVTGRNLHGYVHLVPVIEGMPAVVR